MLAKDLTRRPSLAQMRHVIAKAQASSPSATRPNSLVRAASPRLQTPVATPRPASVVTVDKSRTSRRLLVALGGLVVLGVVIAVVVARSGPASIDQPRRVTDEPRIAIEIDGSVAPIATATPSVVLDASVPLAMPAPPVDAIAVTSRSNNDPDSPSAARRLLDAGAQESEPATVVESDDKSTTVDTTTVDASVEPEDLETIEMATGDAAVKPDVPVTPPKTVVSPHRTPPPPTAKKSPPKRDATPPVPAVKKLQNRDGITNPFEKKPITK
jgi:hypothetical protein